MQPGTGDTGHTHEPDRRQERTHMRKQADTCTSTRIGEALKFRSFPLLQYGTVRVSWKICHTSTRVPSLSLGGHSPKQEEHGDRGWKKAPCKKFLTPIALCGMRQRLRRLGVLLHATLASGALVSLSPFTTTVRRPSLKQHRVQKHITCDTGNVVPATVSTSLPLTYKWVSLPLVFHY